MSREFYISVFVIFTLYQVSENAKPAIWPNQKEIVINEGDLLEIACTGPKPIKFIYPTDVDEVVNTSVPIHQYSGKRYHEENGIHKYVFQRPRTVFGDTGWYGCVDSNVKVAPNNYSDPEVNWLYVYVKSDKNLFVQADYLTSLHATSGESAVIPCRPTSPNLTVTLFDIDENELDDKASFDPRIGFTIQNLTVKDSDWFSCAIEKDNEVHRVNYHLSVHRRQVLSKPKINDETLRHVIRGQDLYVNCTVDIDADTTYMFNWTTPQQSSRISTQQFSEVSGKNTLIATCQLAIRNVMYEDAGEYECFIKSYNDIKETREYITVHDPQIKYINLTSLDSDRNYQVKDGSSIRWVVYVDGYPKPNLHWYNPRGDEIIGGKEYSVDTTSTSIILRINPIKVEHMGTYILEATNQDVIEKLNFTLDVLVKPVTILTGIESYYAPNKTAKFRCDILAFPLPNITWTFLKYPNYPSRENSSSEELTDVSIENTITTSISRAKMLIETSGQINCITCNTLGCDSVAENIFVSDGVGGFGIIRPKEPIVEDDSVELICAASVYNYTNLIIWQDENGKPISETERLQIVSDKTPFTYRSILKIKHVKKSDAEYYTCIGNYVTSEHESTDYKLVVYDKIPPFFNRTNMNGTNVKNIDVITEGHKTVILECFVDGIPTPIVSWYKDNILLKESDQYLFKYNNQQLNIKYVSQQDSGLYLCRASSRLGTKEAYQQIIVKHAKWQAHDIGLAITIAILGIFVVILAIFFTIKVRRERRMRKELMEAGLMHFEEGALECLNPDLTVDDQAELLPYDKKWEFSRERLKLGKQLGSGEFGVVMKAEAQGICEEETITTVAVKMIRRTTNPTYVRALASELKIMVHLGRHLNVVNLLGACTKNISKRELLVIVEYCRFGNLHNYLLRHRNNFINQIDPNTGKFDPTIGMDILKRTDSVSSNNRVKYAALSFSRSLSANSDIDTVNYSTEMDPESQEINMSHGSCVNSNNCPQPGWRSNYHGDYKEQNLKPICTQDLLSWAFQVARGMEYLSQRRVLHGDLAARNILLAENNVVKICDFGLAKTMYKDDNYKKKGDGPLPIKWMAIESIRDRIFSTQSDIWSFGIVLWEFFTLAKTPYPGMEAEKQYQKLIEGYRMEQPEYATREVYDIMLQCWKAKPTLRPSFTDLVESIGDLLEDSVKSYYISLNTPYMDLNTMTMENGKDDYLTMMSAPDHAVLSSPNRDYVNSPISEGSQDSAYLCMSPNSRKSESGIFSPRPHQSNSHFEFPSHGSDSEDAVELSPMLKQEEDPYLKPINVHERRAEFSRQREAMKNQIANRPIERDSGYCNAPQNLHLIDLNDTNDETDSAQSKQTDSNKTNKATRKKEYTPSIISTQDNYVNMPKQKSDIRRDVSDSFSNPNYMMINNHEMDQNV